jgi:branched-chain amino acid transport system ATP-binding protein
MARPRLVLLDEPSMGLAPLVVSEILKQIRRLSEAGTTVLLVEQNARSALAIADRGYVIETGRVVLAGSADELKRDPRIQAAYLGRATKEAGPRYSGSQLR